MLDAASLINLDLYRADPRFAGADGHGYSAVIIDTGVDLNHPSFGPDQNSDGVADRIVYQYDFADRDANASDGSSTSHGSHVAGVVGSADTTHFGVAPGVQLIILKVFKDSGGGAEMADIEAALQWVEQNVATYNIVAVNLSLGVGNYASAETGYVISDEFARLDGLGVICVAAAGNDFSNSGSQIGVSYPSADPKVLAVSAVWADDYGAQSYEGAVDNTTAPDRVASFSQRHPQLTDIFAPGGLITSTDRNGGVITRRGTSMAAPFVTGAAVLAQQLSVRERGRRLTTTEFRDLLRSTGIQIQDGDDENDNVTNTGANYRRLNLLSLGEALLAVPGPPTLTIENLVFTETSAGPTAAGLTVRLSRAPASRVTVDFHTIEGSAKANDFISASGSLTFDPGGPIQQTISVLVVGDLLPEPDENLAVDLSNARGATIGRARGVVVIVDDDEALSYHNSLEPRDVNGDRKISALDALIVINEINAKGSYRLPSPPTPKQPWSFYDVNMDGKISALDALIVINHINNSIARPSDEPAVAPGNLSPDLRARAVEPLDAIAAATTSTTARASAADAVFALSSAVADAPFACNNRAAVYRETYRRQNSPRFSSLPHA
ncbi:MAG: S8 family serine peptidase [Planctomycetia bacterium]|nr:S8 family serine peptidase [Planctomycetia bacterium]